jgi:hypothetical protein
MVRRNKDPFGFRAHEAEVLARQKAENKAKVWGVFVFTPNASPGLPVQQDPSRGYVAREANPATGRGAHWPYSQFSAVKIYKREVDADKAAHKMTFAPSPSAPSGEGRRPGFSAGRAGSSQMRWSSVADLRRSIHRGVELVIVEHSDPALAGKRVLVTEAFSPAFYFTANGVRHEVRWPATSHVSLRSGGVFELRYGHGARSHGVFRVVGSAEGRSAGQANEPVWQMGPSRYLALHGIHEPWIAEISPMQMGRMSERAKKAYEVKRSAEWTASMKGKQDWAAEVFAAFERGEFTLKSAEAHPDAVSAVRTELVARDKRVLEAAKKVAHVENRIRSIDDVTIGDRLYDIGYSRYVHVVRKFKNGIRVRDDGGREYTADARRFQRFQYNDVPVPGRAGGRACGCKGSR